MAKRRTFVTGASVCIFIVACSNTTTPTSTSTDNNPTPPGTTPVANVPYAVCQPVYLGFTANGPFAEPATTSCTPAGTPTAGVADSHCVGVPPQPVSTASCSVATAPSEDAAAPAADAGDAGAVSEDAGPPPTPGPCEENGPDYGATMFGTEADDDDCKYHVSYTASPICENNGTYFVVTASYLTRSGAPLTGASTFAELCLNDTHPAPAISAQPPSGKQQVVEGPPGTYTVGPVQFDAPGDWTVRFHFNEFCCDIADDSPHGHAAFHVTVP